MSKHLKCKIILQWLAQVKSSYCLATLHLNYCLQALINTQTIVCTNLIKHVSTKTKAACKQRHWSNPQWSCFMPSRSFIINQACHKWGPWEPKVSLCFYRSHHGKRQGHLYYKMYINSTVLFYVQNGSAVCSNDSCRIII